jgi:hypothetical protein
MNPISTISLFILILIPAVIIAILVIRTNRSQWRAVQAMQGRVSDFKGGPRNGLEAEASVISKKETIAPNAGEIAKVELLVEVHLPGKAPYQVSTCWLVEVKSLDQLMPGKNLPIKVDPNKPLRVSPNVPWARLWVFGK